MKVLALSDIHGNLKVYENIPEMVQTSGAKAVILAGDLLGGLHKYAGSSVEVSHRLQSEEIKELLKNIQVPLLYIMGNDDMIQWEYTEYPFQSLHKQNVRVEGFEFIGYQNTPPFMGGVHEKPEEEMQAD